jgi:cytochrome c553
MTEQQKQSWRPGKRDLMFLAMVAAVVLLLVLGSGDRKTVAVPADDVHRTTLSRAACMSCHWPDGDRPQPDKHRHTKADQCFQCHAEPGQEGSK